MIQQFFSPWHCPHLFWNPKGGAKLRVSRYIHERRFMSTEKENQDKKKAKPVRRALTEAISKVDSQEKADDVIETLEVVASNKTAIQVKQSRSTVETPAQVAEKVEDVVRFAPEGKETENALKETARAVVSADGREKEILSDTAQEVMNPEQQGATPSLINVHQREYLRTAVLKRLKPLDALDANIFLAINHLPHTRFLNAFFYSLTTIFNIVAPWYGEMGIMALRDRKHARTIIREGILPLLITSSLTEMVIKPYFKRRRPFIAIIQAIVIGKKPGTWSFPSGHAAAAFAGAWLLNHQRPRFSLLRYFIASMVGFSRIYLGDHYPGDVATGSLFGLLSAEFFHRLLRRSKWPG
jgi:membrane-associated phospholipid phosphatase